MIEVMKVMRVIKNLFMTQIFLHECPENKVGTAQKKHHVDALLKQVCSCALVRPQGDTY